MQAIRSNCEKTKGGEPHDNACQKQQIRFDVLANADLPGSTDGRGVRRSCRTPAHRAMFALHVIAICPGAF